MDNEDMFELLAFLSSSEVDLTYIGGKTKGYWQCAIDDKIMPSKNFRMEGKNMIDVVVKALVAYENGGVETK